MPISRNLIALVLTASQSQKWQCFLKCILNLVVTFHFRRIQLKDMMTMQNSNVCLDSWCLQLFSMGQVEGTLVHVQHGWCLPDGTYCIKDTKSIIQIPRKVSACQVGIQSETINMAAVHVLQISKISNQHLIIIIKCIYNYILHQ